MSERKVHFENPMYPSYSVCSIRSNYSTYNVFDVTCKNCKNTDAYKKSLAEHERVLKERVQVVSDVVEEPKDKIESIEKKILDAIWEVSGGGVGGNLPCMIIDSSDNYVLCLEEQEPERLFKITVTEMELVEKRSNE